MTIFRCGEFVMYFYPINCLLTMVYRNECFAAVALLLGLAYLPRTFAQRSDSFEGGQPRWLLVDSDCQAQLVSQEISLVQPHSGRTCEMLEVACGAGTMTLLAYPIEPAVILDEFQPTLWTRSSSGRLQLGVRVVFPFAEHPVTQGRLTTILWGDYYSDTGAWQVLRVNSLEKKFGAEVVGLRQRFGAELNLDGAYIDSLVFNAYSGPGRYRIQLDDLNLTGLIPMSATGHPLPNNWREKWRWRYEVEKPNVEQRLWSSPNRPATWLQYQGESMPWLKSMGFSGLVLSQLPSEKQLQRIRDAELGAICPPPPHNLTFNPQVASTIKGWLIGAALDARQSDVARAAAKRVAEMDGELRRPLIGEALEQYWLFSRIADQVILPYPAPLTAGETREKLAWVSQNLETTRKRGEGWVSLQVGPNPALIDQIRVAHGIMTPDEDFAPSQANPLGLRYQTANAVLAGARGFVFRTFKPLELNAPGESQLVAALRWVHSDLALWGPWIVGGQFSAGPTLNRSDYSAASWNVSQSRLVLAVATPPGGQFCVPPTADTALRIDVGNSATPQQVLRLTAGRVERMDTTPTPQGMQWQVERPAPIETFVITSNPHVIDFVRKQMASNLEQRAADQLEIVSYNLGLAAGLINARFDIGAAQTPSSSSRAAIRNLELAQRQLDQGYQALQSGQATGSLGLAERASEMVQALLFESHQVAMSNLAAPQSSPFVIGPTSLRYHWLLANACERGEWRDLELPGAHFRDPRQMESLGWSLEQRPLDEVEMQVEFVPPQTAGMPGLRLAAYGKSAQQSRVESPIRGGYEGASSRVRSAAAAVRAGQLIRVAAKARILRAPTTSDSGLLIYDNQAGPSLGQLARGHDGQLVDIELYRFVVEDGEFRVLAECRGECDIVLESLHTSVIEPAVNRRAYITSPTP